MVNNVSFEVKQGERIVGLLGPNGASKPPSFTRWWDWWKPDEGEVYLNDINIFTKLPMCTKGYKWGIGLPAGKPVCSGNWAWKTISAVLEMTKLSKAEQKEKLEALVDEFRLQESKKE